MSVNVAVRVDAAIVVACVLQYAVSDTTQWRYRRISANIMPLSFPADHVPEG